MVAHIVLITFGYAAMDSQRGVVGEAVHLVVDYPGMLLATAGSAALVMVVVTSIKKARAKLRYESWHLLHLYAYLGVGLALPHQLWTGADFLSHPLAAAFWWIAWCATAAAVVVYRVGLPLIRSTRHQLVVDRVVRESGDVVSVHLTGRPRRRERSAGGPATRDPRADRGAVRPTHRGRADSPRMSDADDPLFAEELRQLERRRPPSSTSNGSAGDYPSSGRSRIVKRIALWFSSTTTILMLLFGYHTSLSGAAVAASSGTSAAAGVVVIAPVTPTAAAT
ncbi:MAG: ferric reductase-like transmembrane domain-containing protein, partial [Mycobacteriales bacterium]